MPMKWPGERTIAESRRSRGFEIYWRNLHPLAWHVGGVVTGRELEGAMKGYVQNAEEAVQWADTIDKNVITNKIMCLAHLFMGFL